MILYYTKQNKKGKPIYYRVDDGKKTIISRTEYEKNQIEQNMTAVPVPESEQKNQIEQNANPVTEYTNEFVSESEQENEIVPEPEEEYVIVCEIEEENEIVPEPEQESEIVPKKEIKAIPQFNPTGSAQKILTSTLGIVKNVMESMEQIPKYDLTTQQIHNYTLIKYRNCAIIALIVNQKNEVEEFCFMGTTAQKRNRLTKYQFNGINDIKNRKDEIRAQFEFIDEWKSYSNLNDAIPEQSSGHVPVRDEKQAAASA